MPVANIPIIDGDGHILEDVPGIVKFLPSPYKEMVTSPYNRIPLLFPALDHLHTAFRENPATRAGRGWVGPEEWFAFLEDVGIETTVLYPSSGLSYGLIPNPDVAIAVTRAYNNWLAETYLSRSPRFKGMGIIPLQEPAAAAEELRRIVRDLGMCGAMLPSRILKGHLGAKEYWPIYAEADRLGCCLAIHGGSHEGLWMDGMELFAPVHALGHPFGIAVAFAGILAHGVLDRFPHVRLGFLESGVAWLLLAMERLDGSYAAFSQPDPRGEYLALQPGEQVSSYIIRQIKAGRIFVGCEGDELMLAEAIRKVGNAPFIYSSDFPHEVTNATCKAEIHELLENEALTETDKAAILYQNAQRFYNLKIPAPS